MMPRHLLREFVILYPVLKNLEQNLNCRHCDLFSCSVVITISVLALKQLLAGRIVGGVCMPCLFRFLALVLRHLLTECALLCEVSSGSALSCALNSDGLN